MDHDHSLLFGMASIGAASSVVVGRTPQIAVLAQAVLGVGIEKRVPPVGLEQPLDIARGGDAGGERAFAGEFEPFLTVGAGQPQYAETGAHRLLGMLARVEQTVDIGADGKPEGGGLGAQLVRGALGLFRRIPPFGLGTPPRPRKGATVAAITCRSAARP